ncbi:hypothetical protein J132_10322 [Termitomyces sp. J132]|nr:hypothetical protein J132_10322 [Termitomyces sp. J132]
MRPQYLGPLVVISCNCGGAYILCELDCSVLHCPVAAFLLVSYFARKHILMTSNAFDINTSHLHELKQTDFVDNNDASNITNKNNN